MPNRLAGETSPYLLQHRDNPVEWYPWGAEALARARAEDRPILLSVGYSACHWCHVMERESFEDAETAAYMNAHFVNVKVDREERPDVDALYMEAVQAISGQGGWPMTVFCDSDGVPFYGGTYFPPEEGRGMPSFRMVMEGVVDAFEERRAEIAERAPEMRARLGAIGRLEANGEQAGAAELETAVERLRAGADLARGGFGGAPKFPPASALELLMARGERRIVERTLDAMLTGGIYDQLGGGFSRYSVDAAWLVPHFEKMLYDNALLAQAYLHGWQALGHERYRRVCEETLDWALREMRGPEGGFFSAYDADSEGEEGRFYTWTPAEIHAALTGTADEGTNCIKFPFQQVGNLMQFYGVTETGNFEGRTVLHLAQGVEAVEPEGLEAMRRVLYDVRARRVWPGLDDKRLASWNALMIGTLAEAGAVLEREDYLDAARGCAEFVWTDLRDAEGNLLRTYKDGRAHLSAYLEDHAFLLEALLTLYESSFEPIWLERARLLADEILDRFADEERGGFFSTAIDQEALIARRKEVSDHPIPSGNASAAFGLLRLATLTGERRYEQSAVDALRLFAGPAGRHPDAFAHFLRALDFYLAPTKEVALVGNDLQELTRVVRSSFRPHRVLAGGPEGSTTPELLQSRTTIDGEPTAYVCEHFTCQAPTTDPQTLQRAL